MPADLVLAAGLLGGRMGGVFVFVFCLWATAVVLRGHSRGAPGTQWGCPGSNPRRPHTVKASTQHAVLLLGPCRSRFIGL